MFSHIQVKVSELKGNSDVIPRSGERSRHMFTVPCNVMSMSIQCHYYGIQAFMMLSVSDILK